MTETLWVVTSSAPTATGFAQECFDDSAKKHNHQIEVG
jgi:hypothetical protein